MAATPKISLEQWRALLAVVDTGGYAQAAAALHKSQSAVTYAVQKMESLLGVKIFEVIGRKAASLRPGKSSIGGRDRCWMRPAHWRARRRVWRWVGSRSCASRSRSSFRPGCCSTASAASPRTGRKRASSCTKPCSAARKRRFSSGGWTLRVLAGATRIHRRFSDPFTLHSGCPSEPSAAWARRELTLQDLRKHRHLVIRDTGSQRRGARGSARNRSGR